MSNKEVYIVTLGEYSSYSIDCVWSSEKLAKQYVERYGGRVEKYTLNPFEKELKVGVSLWAVSMEKDGTVRGVATPEVPQSYSREWVDFTNVPWDNDIDLYSKVFAKSEEQAIKITNERRTMILAENLWGIEFVEEINQRLGLK